MWTILHVWDTPSTNCKWKGWFCCSLRCLTSKPAVPNKTPQFNLWAFLVVMECECTSNAGFIALIWQWHSGTALWYHVTWVSVSPVMYDHRPPPIGLAEKPSKLALSVNELEDVYWIAGTVRLQERLSLCERLVTVSLYLCRQGFVSLCGWCGDSITKLWKFCS